MTCQRKTISLLLYAVAIGMFCAFSLPANLGYTEPLPKTAVTRDNHPTTPQICSGWKNASQPILGGGTCSAGEAVYSSARPRDVGPFDILTDPIRGRCCPLPAPDILSNEHLMAETGCPEDYVVTGTSSMAPEPHAEARKFQIRCTKINTRRYQLGGKKPGLYWGMNFSFYLQKKRILWDEIPPALRYGTGRTTPIIWEPVGCIGFPFGSLLVSREGRECSQSFYRELQYRGGEGDPPAGTPVRMLADCDELSDIFTPAPRCIKYEGLEQ